MVENVRFEKQEAKGLCGEPLRDMLVLHVIWTKKFKNGQYILQWSILLFLAPQVNPRPMFRLALHNTYDGAHLMSAGV